MKTKPSIVLLALSGLLIPAALGATAVAPPVKGYVLYGGEASLPIGSVLTKNETVAMKDAVVKIVMQGQNMKGTMSQNQESHRLVTIESATQRKVEIKKDTTAGTIVMNGRVMPRTVKPGALQGEVVILTKVDEKWSAKLKEGVSNDKQKKKLKKMARSLNSPDDEVILGTKPRAVGEVWDVDPSKLNSFVGDDVEAAEGTFKVLFKEVRKNEQGLECAVLVYTVDLKGKLDDGTKVSMVGKATVFQSLKYQTSVSVSMHVKATMAGTIQEGAGTMRVMGTMKMVNKTTIQHP